MSKAFLRESDHEAQLPELPRASAALPPGVKNLMTAAGAERLRAEWRRLEENERPSLAAAAAQDAEKRHELQALDQRIRHVRRILESAEVVAPAACDDVVRFGCTVTVRDRSGASDRFQIVGVDEVDFGGEAISWQSPLARALLNARVGDRVTFQAPAGRRELEIVAVG